jgi:hypothetical protein
MPLANTTPRHCRYRCHRDRSGSGRNYEDLLPRHQALPSRHRSPAAGHISFQAGSYADLHPAITVTVGYDRIGGEQAQWLHHVIDVGEYGLALEDMAGTLAQDAIAVTDQERRDMMALADRMKLEGDLVPRALAACPRTEGGEHA